MNDLSLKFERCFDDEVVKFHVLSDDYSKVCVIIKMNFHITIVKGTGANTGFGNGKQSKQARYSYH